MAVGANGAVLSRMRYKPWGEQRGQSGAAFPTDRLFTGQIWDGDTSSGGTGLYFYNARYYDPALGRFTQADTIVPELGMPMAFDRYAYVYNNPLKHIDTDGHFPWDVVDVIFWALSLTDFARNPSFANAGWVLLDTVSLMPGVPSVGYIRYAGKAGQVADEVIQFVTRYADEALGFAKIAHKPGAYTLLKKFLQANRPNEIKGAKFELEFATRFTNQIVEIGRKLPGGSEIDFVLKGNIFVNVKDYDWGKSFYNMDYGQQATIMDLLRQYDIYAKYANEVRFVFKGSVPDWLIPISIGGSA